MSFSTFFFDLDETLYPSSSGLWLAIRERIDRYLSERMGFPKDQLATVREKYFREYGTTLRGLQANYSINTDEYLAFVHDIPLGAYLHSDPELRAALESIKGQKFIFTNADSAHATRVIKAIGLDGLWDGIIDVHTIAPYCKPMPESFQLALQAAGDPKVHTCLLLDDQARITRAARSLGIFTVLVGREDPGFDADEALLNLAGLPGLLNGRI
ncbi:MAG TPA: pyrimidine 5'-nucleotidase [Anaerolineales bacterium]